MMSMAGVVLAGGAGRRMGGARKPVMPVAGRAMLDRVLDALSAADQRVVVGPAELSLPAEVRRTREDPPGSGPVAAAAAGLALLDPVPDTVALLAADLPLLTAGAVRLLRDALAESTADGAVYVDAAGHRQSLCGVWRTRALNDAMKGLAADRPEGLAGASMRALADRLNVVEVGWTRPGPPPWFDCDTDTDVRRAEEWMGGRAGDGGR